MKNIYYTAHEGRRNANGHTTTRGTVYTIVRGNSPLSGGADCLLSLGEYVHQSGGAGIELAILDVCKKAGISTGGGYYKNWRDKVTLFEL